MIKSKKIFVQICLLTVLIVAFSGCTNSPKSNYVNTQDTLEAFTSRTKNTTEYFGTFSSLNVYDDFSIPANMNKYDEFWEEVKKLMQEIENDVSLSVESSDISRFNMLEYGESIPISKHTANIIKIAKEAFESSGGLYDPTIYPLVDLWAFTPRFNTIDYEPELPYDRERLTSGFPLPEEKYIEGFLKLVDFENIILSGNESDGYTLTKNIKPVTIDGITYEAKLDLGGIAKGYAVDLVVEMLKENKYDYSYFSCGTSSIGILKNASKKSIENETYRYSLELRKPRKGNTDTSSFMSIAIKDTGISSSGDYDHSYEIDGTIYSHIIDPRTGYPMNTIFKSSQKGIATVTLIGNNSTFCDAISTAICLMDINDALEYVNKNKSNFKAILILYDSNYDYYEVLTNLDSEEYLIHDDAYKIASFLDDNGNINYSGIFLK